MYYYISFLNHLLMCLMTFGLLFKYPMHRNKIKNIAPSYYASLTIVYSKLMKTVLPVNIYIYL